MRLVRHSAKTIGREFTREIARGAIRNLVRGEARVPAWIVLAGEKQIEVYRRAEQGRYQEKRIAGPGDLIECASVPALRIQDSDLFA